MILTPRQDAALDVMNGAAKHILLDGGSRSGKTALIVRNIAARAIKAPRSRHAILRFRFNHCKESIGMDTLPKVMESCFPTCSYELNKSDWYVKLPNDAEIWLGGLDDKDRTEKILGKEFATLYLNEASQIDYSSRNVAVTRLAQKCPYELAGRQRELALKLYCDCNPPNKGHWTYQLFYLKRDPDTKKQLEQPDNYQHFTLNPGDNAANLPDDYIRELQALPARLRKRFLLGEYADATPNALFHDETIEKWRVLDGSAPDFVRVVVAVDPSGSGDIDNADNDAIGIVVAALGVDGNAYVLEDCTVKVGPATWGKIATDAYDRHAADVVVGEVNYGGEMVRHTIQTSRARTPYKAVSATRGKVVRAEPIAALYELGKCVARGTLVRLERGEVPVESVRAGDMAWTRAGLRRVTWAGSLGEKETVRVRAAGHLLRCSGEHPVWVDGEGFIRANNIAPNSDTILAWNISANRVRLPSPGGAVSDAARAQQRSDGKPGQFLGRLWYSMVSGISQLPRVTGAALDRACFIATSGLWPMDRFLPGGMSITLTATQATTRSPISWHCPRNIIAANIPGIPWQMLLRRASDNPKRSRGREPSQSDTYASSAMAHSCRRERKCDSARQPATVGIGVGGVENAGWCEVFDLTVDGGEYFANDILVHNCRHVGYFRELEDELSGFSTVGYLGDRSPNRADALIYAITELFPGVVAGKREKKTVERRSYAGAWQG